MTISAVKDDALIVEPPFKIIIGSNRKKEYGLR